MLFVIKHKIAVAEMAKGGLGSAEVLPIIKRVHTKHCGSAIESYG